MLLLYDDVFSPYSRKVRIALYETGCELRERYNPDESLRQRRVIGLDILRGLARSPAANAVWNGGTIYDPDSGKTYKGGRYPKKWEELGPRYNQ